MPHFAQIINAIHIAVLLLFTAACLWVVWWLVKQLLDFV
jgi:hypothetical protein